ncbi:MAG: hypothetical protein ACLPY5_09960 [Candidatus Bathyarchaeia archaeon]
MQTKLRLCVFAGMLVIVSLMSFSSSYLVLVSGQGASLTLTSTDIYTLTTTSYGTLTQLSGLYTTGSLTKLTATTTVTSTIGSGTTTLTKTYQTESTVLATNTTVSLATLSGTQTITTATKVSSTIPYPTGRTIGYVGCSNTEDAVAGYQMVTNSSESHFWYPYATGGGVLNYWANPNATYFWPLYETQVANYGQPKIVWLQICEAQTTPLTPLMVNETIANIQALSPGVTIYISPLNTYAPVGSCGITGANGVEDATTLANQAVAEGLALPGPILGPLNSQNTVGGGPDAGCHPNQAGEILEGNQLNAFFNRSTCVLQVWQLEMRQTRTSLSFYHPTRG